MTTATSFGTLFDIAGRCAVVTGASSGIGRHLAKTLAAAGAHVILAARRVDESQRVVAEIEHDDGSATALQMDVADGVSVDHGFDCILNTHDQVDILVNNAGIAVTVPVSDHSVQDWDRVLDTNLKGAWLCTRRVLQTSSRVRSRGCSIINIASVYGFRGAAQLSAYCASKGGMISLTQATSIEAARLGVRVNALAPGYIETDLNRDFLHSKPGQALRQRIPMGEFGNPESLDGALLYLASDASSYMTGTVMTVDGGHSAAL